MRRPLSLRLSLRLGLSLAAVVLGGVAAQAEAASCSKPLPAESYPEFIESNIPGDLDPNLATPPTPTTKIYFNVLVPERCPGDRFPVVFNYAAWGTHRITTLAKSDRLLTNGSMALSAEQFLRQLPAYGYILISADPRGIGDSVPANGGGVQRLMDPNAEIQDARQILDWAYDHAAEFGIQTESGTGIAKDIKLGTFGLSYGGGYQMALAALDARVDAIVPAMTWNDMKYTIVPGEAVKLGWADVLCLSGTAAGQKYTPDLAALCRIVSVSDPQAGLMRTLYDVSHFVGDVPGETPTQIQLARQQQLAKTFGVSSFPSQDEFVAFLEHPGMAWFASQQAAGQPWGFGESVAKLRPVPALFIQGNSDLLFNLTEAYWNWRYFRAAGGDTRLMSANSGHNAFLSLRSAKCGAVDTVSATLAWFNRYLKGEDSPELQSLAPVCISVSPTPGAPHVPNSGLRLTDFPVGSLSGTGAVPAQLGSAHASMKAFATQPQFVPVTTVAGNDNLLAGVPTMASIRVSAGKGAIPDHHVVAFVATGIRRNGKVFAVDQQVTAFAEGSHTRADMNVNQDDRVLLPAIGEPLQDGDEVGLLFYPQNYDFSALLSAQTVSNVPQLLEQVIGINAGSRLLDAGATLTGLAYVNPYEVDVSDVQLPILVPGTYPGSSLDQ